MITKRKLSEIKSEIRQLEGKVKLAEAREKAKLEYKNLKKRKKDLQLRNIKSKISKSKAFYRESRKVLTPYVKKGNSIFGVNSFKIKI